MKPLPTAPADRPWSWQRWLLFIGLTFTAHVGFILAFGDRQPVVRRKVVDAPALQFLTLRSEREQLEDPTLFALPHPNGFAGAAWLRRPQIDFAPFRWTESPRLLSLSVADLGATFQQRMAVNDSLQHQIEILPPPKLAELALPVLKVVPARPSNFSLGGELAQRQWLNAPADLPSWTATDLLTNSLVEVWVEANGQILSPTIMLPGSGLKEADQLAMKLARTAHFTPLIGRSTNLTHGALNFHWHTVPPTNAILTSP